MNSRQIPLWSPKSDHSRFDSFLLEGEVNALVVQKLRDYLFVADTTPIFLHGAIGIGKTHLLAATANLARELGHKKTMYIDFAAEGFNIQFLESLPPQMCLCLDNIDVGQGNVSKDHKESVLFSIVEMAKNTDQRLILSAQFAPTPDLFDLKDLVSRLNSGLVFQLEQLSDKGRLKALKQRFDQRDMAVEDKVLNYLLANYARDNHSLFAALDKLDAASLVEKRKLTIPFVQKTLEI